MLKIKSEYPDLDKYQNKYGSFCYYKKNTDKYHNPYGPAFISKDGYIEYWIEDNLHRLDGPAIISSDGRVEYYINDTALSEEQFEMHPERLKFLGKEYLICLK